MTTITTYFLLFFGISNALCAMNADTSHNKAYGQTTLHIAASKGDRRACKTLIKQLIDIHQTIDQVDNEGNTPLHIAASKGHYKICVLLVTKGASLSARNFRQLIPYDVRKRSKDPHLQEEFAELLIPIGTLSDDSSSDSEDTSLDQPSGNMPLMFSEIDENTADSLRCRHNRVPLRKRSL